MKVAVVSLEKIREMAIAGMPSITEKMLQIVENPAVLSQSSLLVDKAILLEFAEFLRDHRELRFDYCSNVTGVDWPDRVVKEKVVREELVEGEPKRVEVEVERVEAGYLEVVYHLYSVVKKSGLLVLRVRTGDRVGDVEVPSLTPVWKSAEFQEREVYDLYGVKFGGHPDLRRLLLWDEFAGYPMRKDYEPEDDSYVGEVEKEGGES